MDTKKDNTAAASGVAVPAAAKPSTETSSSQPRADPSVAGSSVTEAAAALVSAIEAARKRGQIVQLPFRLEDLGRIAVSDTGKTA